MDTNKKPLAKGECLSGCEVEAPAVGMLDSSLEHPWLLPVNPPEPIPILRHFLSCSLLNSSP